MKTLRIRMLIFFSKMRHFGNIENKIIKTISDPHVPNKFLTFFVLKNKKKKKFSQIITKQTLQLLVER